jgi:hypothetical protein
MTDVADKYEAVTTLLGVVYARLGVGERARVTFRVTRSQGLDETGDGER